MRICRACFQEKDDSEMATQMDRGKFRYRSYCKKCNRKQLDKLAHKPETLKAKANRRHERVKQHIDNGSIFHIAARILNDCRKNDKRKDMICDLDLSFVMDAIQHPCSYCGEANYRRSLDRINNGIGHLKSNVVTACVRCNLTRTTMPYDAWLVVAKGMREAREQGLFGDWVGILRCESRKNGADREDRTRTGSLPTGFGSVASANSATSANFIQFW